MTSRLYLDSSQEKKTQAALGLEDYKSASTKLKYKFVLTVEMHDFLLFTLHAKFSFGHLSRFEI